ncbi:MAG TPA: carboxypeptidase-like regulatory domain-containing protein, partial [Pyrinomonadaceae bacterium]|nr:carboxypeptidase-like regulatory domain-containing protein [Pyrinomonadaceae bacterium]
MNTNTLRRALLCALVALAASSPAAYAQGTASRVTGVVTDQSGAVVPGATVTLTNEGTNVSITTETTSTGAYVFDLVQVGNYTVSVEKQGFKRYVSTGNPVNINQPATVNVSLEAGSVSETVTVTAAAEQVQT